MYIRQMVFPFTLTATEASLISLAITKHAHKRYLEVFVILSDDVCELSHSLP